MFLEGLYRSSLLVSRNAISIKVKCHSNCRGLFFFVVRSCIIFDRILAFCRCNTCLRLVWEKFEHSVEIIVDSLLCKRSERGLKNAIL